MIRLTDLSGKGSFTMGGKKFEYGKVYSNPYATAFKPVNEAEESEDHEVSMAQNQLDSIIKAATELKQKMGEDEKQIPAWIQDHITNSENYISQAASNYHEYGDSNENIVSEDIKIRDGKYEFSTKRGIASLKFNGKEIASGDFDRGADAYFMSHSSWKGQKSFNDGKDVIAFFKKSRIVTEAGPCWKGYKQVGMKDKGGKQVPNCVPEAVVKEGRGVGMIQKDYTKVLDTIQSELQKYKLNKGTDKAKQNVENLKKLNVQKQKLEAELDGKVSSLYKDYDLDQLNYLKTIRR